MIDTTNSLGALGPKNTRGKVGGSPASEAKTPAPGNTTAEKPESGDQVKLSAEAQNMSRLEAKVASSADVNLEKVAAIRQAIAEGKFEFNPERIAENMLKQDDLLA